MQQEGWHTEGADDGASGCGLRVSGISLGPAAFYFRQRWVFVILLRVLSAPAISVVIAQTRRSITTLALVLVVCSAFYCYCLYCLLCTYCL